MSRAGAGLAVGVSFALAAVMAAGSQWPMGSAVDHAVVRLSWRTEPVRIETCRTLTAEELESVPAHMRRAEECVGAFAEYELRVRIDDVTLAVDTVAPSGLRGDRPVYVLREEPVDPGEHRIDVTFTALLPEGYVPDDGPARLEWSGTWSLEAGEIGLVTVDASGSELVTVRTP